MKKIVLIVALVMMVAAMGVVFATDLISPSEGLVSPSETVEANTPRTKPDDYYQLNLVQELGADFFSEENYLKSIESPVVPIQGPDQVFEEEERAFSDVDVSHWACYYIESMKGSNIINGYPDGTFRPDDKVKEGEFIKMTAVVNYPLYEYVPPKEGLHWAWPYVKLMDGLTLNMYMYTYQVPGYDLDGELSRGEAAIMLAKLHKNLVGKAENGMNVIQRVPVVDESYLQNDANRFSDIRDIEDDELKEAIGYCVSVGLINGFEDGTFRKDDILTRAQCAKLISLLVGIGGAR